MDTNDEFEKWFFKQQYGKLGSPMYAMAMLAWDARGEYESAWSAAQAQGVDLPAAANVIDWELRHNYPRPVVIAAVKKIAEVWGLTTTPPEQPSSGGGE